MKRKQAIALTVFLFLALPLLVWAATTTHRIQGNLAVSAEVRAPKVSATTTLAGEALNVFGAVNNTTGTVRSAVVRATTNLMAAGATVYGNVNVATATVNAAQVNTPVLASTTTEVAVEDDFLLAGSGQDYRFTRYGTNFQGLQNTTAGGASIFSLFASDGDATDSVFVNVFGKGTPTATTNVERLALAYNTTGTRMEVASLAAGSGTKRSLALYVGANTNQLVLNPSGQVTASDSIASAGVSSTTGNFTADVTVGDAAGDTTTITGLLTGSVTNVGPFTQPVILGGGDYAYYGGIVCSNTWGWVASGNGSIISLTGRVGALSTIYVYKNGASVWTAYTSTGATNFHAYNTAKGTDTFVANDVLTVYNSNGTANGDHYDLQVTLDSFPASGP